MRIPIHPKDDTFVKLMRIAADGIRKDNKVIINKAKSEFKKDSIDLFYNSEEDTIRVLRKDCPPIDFPVSHYSNLPKKK